MQQLDDKWALERMETWLDQDYCVSNDALEKRGWRALPVPDHVDAIEAEWLAEAVQKLGANQIIGVAFEFQGQPEIERVDIHRDAILRYIAKNSWKYALITNAAESFLFFKDEANRYFLICGPNDFVRSAYRCSVDTARKTFLDWANDDDNPSVKKYLLDVWAQYDTPRVRQE